MIRFRIQIGAQSTDFSAEDSVVTFGRGPKNTIQVSDPRADEDHCRLERTESGWKLVDLESTHGTSVNGKPTNACVVKDGDAISIGAFVAVVNPIVVETVAAGPAPRVVAPQVPVFEHAQRSAIAGSRRERESSRGLLVTGFLAIAILGGGGWAAHHFLGGPGFAKERETYAAATATAAKGDWDGAEKTLAELAAKPLPVDLKRDTKKALDDLHGKIAARDAKAKQDADAAAASAAAAQHEADLRAQFDVATAAADALVVQESFGPAMDVWKRFSADNPNSSLAKKVDDRMIEIVKATEDAWVTVDNRADSLVKLDEAKSALALVGSAIERFQGTRYYFSAQEKMAELQKAVGGAAAVASTETKLSVKVQDLILLVNDMVKARRYSDALAELDKAIPAAADAEKPGLESRRSDVRMQSALFDKLTAAVNNGWFKTRPIDAEDGMSIFLTKATAEELVMDIRDESGWGGTTTKRWAVMGANELAIYLTKLELGVNDRVALAVYCYGNGLPERASDVLRDLLKEDPKMQDVAFEVIARHKGISVPSSGFQYYDSGWYTNDELTYAKIDLDAKNASGLVALVDAAKAKQGYALFKKLMDDPATPVDARSRIQAQFLGALQGRRAGLLRRLQDARGMTTLAVMREVKKELNRRRDKAVLKIYDKGRYADADGGKAGQQAVDEAVAAVRQIWENPIEYAQSATGIADVTKALLQSDEWLRELGQNFDDSAAIGQAVAEIGRVMNVREFCLSEYEFNVMMRYQVVKQVNDANTSLTSVERELANAINDYRFMMGRMALEAIPQLIVASREHSANMNQGKFFSHECSIANRKTPFERCRTAGFSGTFLGENIGKGSGTGTVIYDSWIHSAPDHRNILIADATRMGAGNNSTLWTALFGRGGNAGEADTQDKGMGTSKQGKSGSSSSTTAGQGGSTWTSWSKSWGSSGGATPC